MLADVGERFLDHPVRDQAGRRGNRPDRPLDRAVDPQPGPAERGHELIEIVQVGRGLHRSGRLARLSEQADGVAQVVERRAAGLPDVRERLPGLDRVVIEQLVGDPGLHVDQRQVMAHRVVQVAGDPQPLLGHPSPGLLLAAEFRAPGALGYLGDVRAAAAGRVSGGQRQPDGREHGQGLPPDPRPGSEEHMYSAEHGQNDYPDGQGPTSAARAGHGVERDQGRDEYQPVGLGQHDVAGRADGTHR